ncbi:cation efflux protein [Mariannaea sp. PMI_226]|nr:cation efflux protein [Mariannaea sp. PMI_226]
MGEFEISRKQRLSITISVSLCFFVVELGVGFHTHSLVLIADAFHYLSDLIGTLVALVALMISERNEPAPQKYTFGWQRATLLGAFFNGVFLLALAVSILVQAIQRFINITRRRVAVEEPKQILIVGCVGLALNLLVMSFLHEHDHSHGHEHGHGHDDDVESNRSTGQHRALDTPSHEARNELDARLTPPQSDLRSHVEHKHSGVMGVPPGRDLGMLGVFIHIMGDAINNVGVIIAAVIIWKASGEGRYYADPAVGVFIALMILLSAIPLVKNSGAILLQIAPSGISLGDIKHDIEMIPGIKSVHELHIWRLDQRKSIASAHVVVDGRTVKGFTEKAKIIMECLHAYGIHSATLQPEVSTAGPVTLSDNVQTSQTTATEVGSTLLTTRRRGTNEQEHCQLTCSSVCDDMRCCTDMQMQ